MHMYVLEIQEQRIFCKDFLNNFIEVISFILYLYIFIHIYLLLKELNICLRHLELCTAEYPTVLYY